MAHPRCVAWGEMGLDYHYDKSPRDIQRTVFARQLKQAVKLGKPLTIHTREADEDTERILKEEVPKDHIVRTYFGSGTLINSLPRSIDTYPLLHGFSRFRSTTSRPLPQSIYRHHRSVFLVRLLY